MNIVDHEKIYNNMEKRRSGSTSRQDCKKINKQYSRGSRDSRSKSSRGRNNRNNRSKDTRYRSDTHNNRSRDTRYKSDNKNSRSRDDTRHSNDDNYIIKKKQKCVEPHVLSNPESNLGIGFDINLAKSLLNMVQTKQTQPNTKEINTKKTKIAKEKAIEAKKTYYRNLFKRPYDPCISNNKPIPYDPELSVFLYYLGDESKMPYDPFT